MTDALKSLHALPDLTSVFTAIADLNGQARGKRLPFARAEKALSGGMRMPLSILNVDVRGDDIEESPLVFETGDQDGILGPTERGFVPAPWIEGAALLPMQMQVEDGSPFAGDARGALRTVLDRYAARGWQVAAATELEFYLVDPTTSDLQTSRSRITDKRHTSGEILSLDAMAAYEPFFAELYAGAEAMGIKADAATSESGAGQFEVNLVHGPALRMADDTWLFKQLVKGMARKHGFAATFMAKPFETQPGNGLHLHFSVVDAKGQNIFDDGTAHGTNALRHAVAGCLDAMAESTLVFAPHANSYARLVPESHAPTGIGWAYENRTAAIRVPGGDHAARRLEHRVAGGDTNPYLVMASVLGAALVGMEQRTTPPAPLEGNVYAQDLAQIPSDWDAAIVRLEKSAALRDILPDLLIENLVRTKRQEQGYAAALDHKGQVALYLDTA